MRLFGAALFLAAFALASPDRASADGVWTTVFRDDFDGVVLNDAAWVVESANGSYDVSGGALKLRSLPSGLPQIATRAGVIPAGAPIKLRFGFQFGSTTCFGTALGARVPDCRAECGCPPYYAFHRDCAVGTIARMPGADRCNVAVTPFEPGAPEYHVGEWVIYADSTIAKVDGVTIYSSIGNWPTPSAIWMGSIGSPCCSYTELSVDFAEVQALTQPVPVQKNSWGRLKSHYR